MRKYQQNKYILRVITELKKNTGQFSSQDVEKMSNFETH